MMTFSVGTLGEAWLNSIELVMKDGEDILDDRRKLKEIRNLYITIKDIREDDIILQKHADKERIKLMKEKYATCGLVGDYKIDYGSYIYDNNGINQMEWLRERIQNKPETKSATITLHRPGENMLACLSLMDFKLRQEKLYMTVIYRSQNIFSSQPGNLIALRRMHEDLAAQLSVKIGDTELIVISAHIYEEDYEAAIKILRDESLHA
jgi:thymidylate synthase